MRSFSISLSAGLEIADVREKHADDLRYGAAETRTQTVDIADIENPIAIFDLNKQSQIVALSQDVGLPRLGDASIGMCTEASALEQFQHFDFKRFSGWCFL